MSSTYLQSLKSFALAASRFPRAKAKAGPPKRKRPGSGESDAVPADPTRPGSLDGGAAAALAFDE